MSNLEIKAKLNLKTTYYENQLFFFSSGEKDVYERIIKNLNDDYGYLDVVLDFSDFKELKPMFETITKLQNFDMLKKIVCMQYLLYCIMTNAKIDRLENSSVNLNNIKYNLFGNDIKEFLRGDLLSYNEVLHSLSSKAKKEKEKGYARIICLLDNVNDIELQECINDLIFSRGSVSIIGYTTKNLSTFRTINGTPIISDRDYKLFISEQRLSEDKKEGMRRR